MVGPHARCFCGHSYKAHAWWENDSKRPSCRVAGCACDCFTYVARRGAATARCGCKHTLEDHRSPKGLPTTRCSKCACRHFVPTTKCACGAVYGDHATVVETLQDRQRAGRATEALWDESRPAETHAVAGGLTSFVSLAPGADRAQLHPSLALPRPTRGGDGAIASPYGAPAPRRGRGRGRGREPRLLPADLASNYEDFINSLGD